VVLGRAGGPYSAGVAPVAFSEGLGGWTSAGIILLRVGFGDSCDPGYTTSGWATFIINPSTGVLSSLFSGNEQYLDADSQDKVAWRSNDGHSVAINGVIYSESKSLVSADVSPDGDHVAVQSSKSKRYL
jgi:hypothetical protein